MAKQDAEKPYGFRFYVTEETSYTEKLLEHIVTVLREKIPGQFALDVVSTISDKKLAQEDEIGLVPCLVRIRPEPKEHWVGLRSEDDVRQALKGVGK